MKMKTMLFRQLIDAAIGSPDAGHVDFYALQCVLYHFADKLNILDSEVDNTKFRNILGIRKKGNKRPSKCNITSAPSRLLAGADDAEAKPAAAENDVPPAAETADNNDETVEPDQAEELIEEQSTVTVLEEESPVPEAEIAIDEQPMEQPTVEPETKAAEPRITGELVAAESTPLERIGEIPSLSEKKASFIQEAKRDTTRDSQLESIKSVEGKIQYLYEPISDDLLMGISIMKEQIELAMEQINMIINMEVSGKRKSLISSLKGVNKKMRTIQRSNFYIESKYRPAEIESALEESMEEGIEGMEELEDDEGEFVPRKTDLKMEPGTMEAEPSILLQPTMEYHLCYPPEKIMDELLDLKAEFCNLTNKVNDIMIALQEIDSQRTKVILSELQEHMREVRYIITVLKDGQEFLNNRIKINNEKIVDLEKAVNILRINKVDHSEMVLALAEKVNFELLERKVSHDQLKEAICRIEKQFCEMQRLINFNEKHALQVIENMRKNLGLDNVDQMLKDFREKVNQDIEKLQQILQNYLDSTNDECAAAGARVQVLKDFACISCDTKCVMRTMEKAKVGKLRNAHVTPGLGPLITYELGSIRKSGLMGYFRKDEFPHAPNAWLNKQNVALSMCLPRHAGGGHTTHTAKELVDKVVKRSK